MSACLEPCSSFLATLYAEAAFDERHTIADGREIVLHAFRLGLPPEPAQIGKAYSNDLVWRCFVCIAKRRTASSIFLARFWASNDRPDQRRKTLPLAQHSTVGRHPFCICLAPEKNVVGVRYYRSNFCIGIKKM